VSERDRYTPEEWRTLQFAPFWMFGAVVGAYNRFDPRDFHVFLRCLEVATLGEGRLRREHESLLLVKTAESRAEAAQEYIRGHHSYDVPEILKLSVDGGSPKYLQWLADQVSQR